MSIFELQLDEFAMWVYVLFFLTLFLFLQIAYLVGLHKGKKRYKYYIPTSEDLTLGAIYSVRMNADVDGNTFLFLERKDGASFGGGGVIVVRPSVTDAHLFPNISSGTLVRRGTGGLHRIE